jgi:hypothetical protein
LGPEHSDTLVTSQGLGMLLKREKRYAEAEGTFRQTLEGRRRGWQACNLFGAEGA